MSVIGIIFTALGGLMLLPFILHFIVYFFVVRDIDRRKKKEKYWNDRIYKSDRLQIFLTKSLDLMISFHHYYSNYWDLDDDERTYARELVIHFGGLSIFWEYGHDFLDPTKWSEDSKTKYYGLYCIDGWHGGWDNLWWGTHLYDLPWRRNKHTGTYVWDKKNNTLLKHDEIKETPYFLVRENALYFNKNRQVQIVPKIEWRLVERNWESPMLRWFGIAKWFKKKIVYLEFDISQNGDKDFNGIGVIKNEWKGGVYGSSIRIEKDTEPVLWKLYKSVVWHGNISRYSRFISELESRITKFMILDKQY